MDLTWRKMLLKKWGIKNCFGHIRIKAVRCGKPNCRKCPHEFYAYHISTLLGATTSKYLGKCDSLGRPLILKPA